MKYPPELIAAVTGRFNSKGKFIMEHRHRARHPKLANLPHTSEMKKADGKPDLPKLLANVDEQIAALKSGKVELLDLDMTDPDPVTSEYYVLARCRAK